jgi:methionine aminopeptidase
MVFVEIPKGSLSEEEEQRDAGKVAKKLLERMKRINQRQSELMEKG